MEHHSPGWHPGLQHLQQVPCDRLALAILIGGEEELVGVLEQFLELGDLLLLIRVDHVERLKVMVYIHPEASPRLAAVLRRDLSRLIRHVTYMADAGLDDV